MVHWHEWRVWKAQNTTKYSYLVVQKAEAGRKRKQKWGEKFTEVRWWERGRVEEVAQVWECGKLGKPWWPIRSWADYGVSARPLRITHHFWLLSTRLSNCVVVLTWLCNTLYSRTNVTLTGPLMRHDSIFTLPQDTYYIVSLLEHYMSS